MNRRAFLRATGGAGAVALAGCVTRESDEEEPEPEEGDEGELRIATYSSFVDTEDAPGEWIREAFEEEYPDAELVWTTPEERVNHYIQQEEQGVTIEADVYVGLNVDDLARIDDQLGAGALFGELDRGRLEHAHRVQTGLEMGDPSGRVIPYDTGYISLVYDENEVETPETFDDLIDSEYESTLLAQSAQTSDPGQAFLLWTIHEFGEEDYLGYWSDLVANDVRILGDWSSSYEAYTNEERPMVVSYSTDQVFASAEGADMSRHQVAFLNDQGYANPEGMAIFEDTTHPDLAYAFVDFMLSEEAQAEIAVRNVQFPAVSEEYVDLPDDFDQYAHEPEEAVTMGYDDLRGNLEEWLDDWSREVIEQ
ncbi:thiamine ABC transporter substrate-binding protein [Natrononativus amylolyticus]|uniref:thiamine ABC transporter substrate-binding protein n=1 Tax=Natrononativus amylolyticus TaxID=2963434 RepID=UPI0020CF9077|nr:thiamine ABC transporter substrate-binding protein [Natrononativus amylolyticus]